MTKNRAPAAGAPFQTHFHPALSLISTNLEPAFCLIVDLSESAQNLSRSWVESCYISCIPLVMLVPFWNLVIPIEYAKSILFLPGSSPGFSQPSDVLVICLLLLKLDTLGRLLPNRGDCIWEISWPQVMSWMKFSMLFLIYTKNQFLLWLRLKSCSSHILPV